MRVLVTGTAGFIGSALAMRLLARGDEVIGVDNMSPYYDVRLKQARLARFASDPGYTHVEADLADREAIDRVFAAHRPARVVNLAAQAGVRYAAENPHVYVASNVTGFLHVLEGCRHHGVEHLVFASTSSVYGANTRIGSPARMARVNRNSAMSGRPQGPYTVKKRRPVQGRPNRCA